MSKHNKKLKNRISQLKLIDNKYTHIYKIIDDYSYSTISAEIALRKISKIIYGYGAWED